VNIKNVSADTAGPTLASIVSVKESLVTIDVSSVAVKKNEVGHILLGKERLKAEVLRIQGGVADMQVFEDTSGVKVGDQVELSGSMLSVTLGPGLLGTVYDGLQTPLATLAKEHGFFLPRGVEAEAVVGVCDLESVVTLGNLLGLRRPRCSCCCHLISP
jgi:V/A-type H+-transporting ATPase subunit A